MKKHLLILFAFVAGMSSLNLMAMNNEADDVQTQVTTVADTTVKAVEAEVQAVAEPVVTEVVEPKVQAVIDTIRVLETVLDTVTIKKTFVDTVTITNYVVDSVTQVFVDTMRILETRVVVDTVKVVDRQFVVDTLHQVLVDTIRKVKVDTVTVVKQVEVPQPNVVYPGNVVYPNNVVYVPLPGGGYQAVVYQPAPGYPQQATPATYPQQVAPATYPQTTPYQPAPAQTVVYPQPVAQPAPVAAEPAPAPVVQPVAAPVAQPAAAPVAQPAAAPVAQPAAAPVAQPVAAPVAQPAPAPVVAEPTPAPVVVEEPVLEPAPASLEEEEPAKTKRQLRKEAKKAKYEGLSHLQKYYLKSGRSALSIITVGYSTGFTCADPMISSKTEYAFKRHYFNASIFEWRAGLFGMSLFNVEMGMNTPNSELGLTQFYHGTEGGFTEATPQTMWFAYKPTAKLYIPFAKWLAFELYGGVEVDMTKMWSKISKNYYSDSSIPENNFFVNGFGGAGFMLTGIPAIPLEIKAEYRAPFKGNPLITPKGFYISTALHLTAPIRKDKKSKKAKEQK